MYPMMPGYFVPPVMFPTAFPYQPPAKNVISEEIDDLIQEIEDGFDKAVDAAEKFVDEVAATISNDFFDAIELADDNYAPVVYVRRDKHDSAEDANYEEIEYETGGFPVKKEGVSIIPFINGTPLGPNCDGWEKSFKPCLDGIQKAASAFGNMLERRLKDPTHDFFDQIITDTPKKKEK